MPLDHIIREKIKYQRDTKKRRVEENKLRGIITLKKNFI